MLMYKYVSGILFLSLFACNLSSGKKQKAPPVKLPHYSLDNPGIYKMPAVLNEISGIAFDDGNDSLVYAEEDEKGKLYSFLLGSDSIKEVKFGKKGDYEDVQICNGYVIMMRSDGMLYVFPLNDAASEDMKNVKEYEGLLPKGEYEGMCADKQNSKLYIICKKCKGDKDALVAGYIFSIDSKGIISPAGNFEVKTKKIAEVKGYDKIKFMPSALAKSSSGDWFILSSINKLLVVTDADWKVKEAYPLNTSIYNQPEGIAFDKAGNLYISNEKGEEVSATICKLTYQQ